MKLTDRTILITGGTAGIGLAFARKFLELGNQVIVTGRRQSTLEQLKASYPTLYTIQSDVADPAQIASLARRVKSDYPNLDALMTNPRFITHKNPPLPPAHLNALPPPYNLILYP